jgi:hypothetical protein
MSCFMEYNILMSEDISINIDYQLWWVDIFRVPISCQYISTSEGKLTLQERIEALRNISGICEL